VPELFAEAYQVKLGEPEVEKQKFEEMVKAAQPAAVLVLVY
jgi:hypothetical protein